MRFMGKASVLITLAGLALVAIFAAVPISEAVAPQAAGKTCGRGFVRAVIAGRLRCLKQKQWCARRHDRQYHRYGFHCHRGRLTRSTKRSPTPLPPPPPPPAPAPAPADLPPPPADPPPPPPPRTIDTTAPETTISSKPNRHTTATSASFSLTSGDEGATFECSLDAAAFSACATPVGYGELPLGEHTFQVRATDQAGNTDPTPAAYTWGVVAGILMAAGDIACAPGEKITETTCRHQYTSDLLMNEPEVTNVLPLGDIQYVDGCYSDFLGAYHPTWGRKLAITKPVPGNHEYHDPTPCPPVASGYFQYFGSAAGDPTKGYYSFDLGPWHLIALNSEISHSLGSPQLEWLQQDLAATTEECILAYWHKPRFSSGRHGSGPGRAALWNALHGAGADLVLSAHDHTYERFAPQDATGQLDLTGIRQFVVGTGGASHYQFPTIEPNSDERNATTFGVLKLTLHASSYDFEFVPEAGGTFTDSGSAACH
jgi:acid phosphatase type 7